jgi:hypothetical protein
MAQTINVLNANAIKLALKYFGDATGFVQIIEANDLTDWAIGAPIITETVMPNLTGDTVLILPPLDGVETGMLVYCDGYGTYGLVTLVETVSQIPAGIPFAQGYADIAALYQSDVAIAESLPPSGRPIRIMPGLGQPVSTNVTITPGLDNLMAAGSTVTFAIGNPIEIVIPTTSNSRGTP